MQKANNAIHFAVLKAKINKFHRNNKLLTAVSYLSAPKASNRPKKFTNPNKWLNAAT